jgi:hypothetical protein
LRGLLIAVAAYAATVVSAQSYRIVRYSYSPYDYRYNQPCYSVTPQVLYVGGRQRASSRTPSNVPFAYGSFFYHQSWEEWQRSQDRERRRRR